MIEKDLKARQGTAKNEITGFFLPATLSKTYTENSSLCSDVSKADDMRTSPKKNNEKEIMSSAALYEADDFEEDFSDFSLPELEDLLK